MADTPPFRSWALALTATATMAVSYCDRQTLSILAPTVTKELGISDFAYGWLASAFSIAYLLGAPVAGILLDKLGARRGLLGSVLLWSAVAALHALVPTVGALFALRIALGFTEAPSFPGAAQTVHRALPPEERARGFGVLFSGSSVGAMIAPPLATYLERHYSWRVAFLGTALAGLAWVPLWMSVAFTERAKAAMDVRETTVRPNLFAVLADPAVLRLTAAVAASAPFIGFVLNWGAKYLARDHHLTPEQYGWYLVVPAIVFDVGAVSFGFVASRHARRGVVGVPRGLLAFGALLMMAGAVVPFAGSPAASIAAASVAMAGGAGLYALALVDATARVSPEVVSTVGGMGAFAQSLAYIIANPIVGRVVEAQGNYTLVLVGLTAWVVPGTVIWLAWVPRAKPKVAAA